MAVDKFKSLLAVLSYILFLSFSQAEVDTTKFGSKNAYSSSFTAGERLETLPQDIQKYCKPLQVTSVLRHGTRNPSTGDINRINSVLQKFQATKANPEAVQQLADVVAKFPLSTQGQLVRAGQLEHEHLGSRMAHTYSSLFNQTDMNELTFSSTSVNRTIDSCKAFQKGFFSEQDEQAPIVNRDDILRFYDYCDAYKELESNASSLVEYTNFQNMTFAGIIQNYTNSLKLPPVDITNDEMNSIYQVSAIEYAAFNTTNWAQYIDQQDLLLIEYSSDLESYYQLGYGYPINYEMSCPLISALFKDMDKVFNGQSYQKGLFYFAHAETVTPLFDILGLYNDTQPLTADNYDQQSNRKFRTSRIIPFATNIDFVQFDCDVQSIKGNSQISPGIFPTEPARNMTLMLVKEIPTMFPLCESLMCPYATVRQVYSKSIDYCNFNATCENNFTSEQVSGSSRIFLDASLLINAVISIFLWFV